MSTPPVAAAGLETVVNRLLAMDADLAEGIAELDGCVLELRLQGVDWRFQLLPSGSRLRVVALDDAPGSDAAVPDVVVCGPPFTLLRVIASAQSIDGVLPPDVSISGDLRVVEMLSKLARRAYLDWEEPLAKVFGDSLGHEVARGLRGIAMWARSASETLVLDTGEYLREERRLTPNRFEVERLANDVEVLRDDVERMEVRIARLVERFRGARR